MRRLIFVFLFVLAAIAPAVAQEATPTTEPTTATVIAEWHINMPVELSFAFGSVWVPSHRSPNITTRIDPVSNEITAAIEGTGYRAHEAVVVDDRLWVTGENNDTAPVDPANNTVGPAIPGHYTALAFGFGSIWATTLTDSVDRLDLATGQVSASIKLRDNNADCNFDVVVSAAAVWVHDCDAGELIEIDPADNHIVAKMSYDELVQQAQAQSTVPDGKGTDFIWTLNPNGLLRIDPDTATGVTFLPLSPVQLGDFWFTVTDDSVWIGGNGQINRVDVATNQINATYAVHSGTPYVGVGYGSLWLAYESLGLVQRLDVSP